MKSVFYILILVPFLFACTNNNRVGFESTNTGLNSAKILINEDDDFTNKGSVTLSLSHNSATEMKISNDSNCLDGVWESYKTSKSGWLLKESNASVSVYVKFKDQNGREFDCISDSIVHDDQPPEVAFDALPPAVINKGSASIIVSANDNLSGVRTLQCSTNDKAYSECDAIRQLQDMNEGNHKYIVRAIDRAGNISQPLMSNWKVDFTSPVVTIESGPEPFTNSSSAQISFRGIDGNQGEVVEYRCRIGTSNYTSCESPMDYDGLTDGPYEFYVIAIDDAGNISPSASHNWSVDTVPPTVSLVSTPANPSGVKTANFEFQGADVGSGVASYSCRLNGVNSPCSSPAAFANLNEGSNRFQVTSIDYAGNVSNPAIYQWTVDTTAPSVEITSAPQDKTLDTSATFRFEGLDAGSGIAGYYCQIDGGAYETCSSPKVYSGLSAGPHTFYVKAVDNVGLMSPPASKTWDILYKPKLSFVKKPGEMFEDQKAEVEFSISTPANTLTCYFDDSTYSPCVPNQLIFLENLEVGPHRFKVVANEGQINSSEIESFWTVKEIGKCSSTNLTKCPVLKDDFERTVLIDGKNDFGWSKVIDDLNRNFVDAKIFSKQKMGVPASGDSSLYYYGREGGSIHAMYLISKPFDLSDYKTLQFSFSYLMVSLERLSNGKAEYFKIDICKESPEDCGVGKNTNINALRSTTLWRSIYEDYAPNNGVNQGLNGRNHSLNDWKTIQDLKVDMDQMDLEKDEIVFRIHVKMDEGFANNDLKKQMVDGLIFDNIKVIAIK